MFNFFGSKKKKEEPKPVPTIDLNVTSHQISKSIQDAQLKFEAVNNALKAQLNIYRSARNATAKAKAKKKAIALLKRKKMYDQHLNHLTNTQMTVDSANIDCQMMKDNMNMMQVMKNVVTVQKQTISELGGADGMFDIIDDMQEIKEEQREINDEFQSTFDVNVNDEEWDSELDELDYQMRIEIDNQGTKVPGENQKKMDEEELEKELDF